MGEEAEEEPSRYTVGGRKKYKALSWRLVTETLGVDSDVLFVSEVVYRVVHRAPPLTPHPS